MIRADCARPSPRELTLLSVVWKETTSMQGGNTIRITVSSVSAPGHANPSGSSPAACPETRARPPARTTGRVTGALLPHASCGCSATRSAAAPRRTRTS